MSSILILKIKDGTIDKQRNDAMTCSDLVLFWPSYAAWDAANTRLRQRLDVIARWRKRTQAKAVAWVALNQLEQKLPVIERR